MKGPCLFPGCKNMRAGRELCVSHLCQRSKGRPLSPLVRYQPRGTVEERFWRKVNKDGPVTSGHPDLGPCWLWIGAVQQGGGYGMFWTPERMRRAHKYSYERAKGPVPDGLELDHLCRVRLCVNPAHLEAVTKSVNNLRAFAAARAIRALATPPGQAKP